MNAVLTIFSALATLGVTEYDPQPPGSESNRVTLDSFMREA